MPRFPLFWRSPHRACSRRPRSLRTKKATCSGSGQEVLFYLANETGGTDTTAIATSSPVTFASAEARNVNGSE